MSFSREAAKAIDESRTLSADAKRTFDVTSDGLDVDWPIRKRKRGRLPRTKTTAREADKANLGVEGILVSSISYKEKVQGMYRASRPSFGGTRPIPQRVNSDANAAELGQNRLATGFASAPPNAASPASLESGETQDDAIAISSDSEPESAGGMVINLEGDSNEESDDGDNEDDDEKESKDQAELGDSQDAVSTSSSSNSFNSDDPEAHNRLQGDLERHLSNNFEPLSLESLRPNKHLDVRLADLNPHDLEEQFKYAFFHLDREQIDLNRAVRCIACLQEGHIDSACPERDCAFCATQKHHSSARCPALRRCLKCRERGHDISTCPAKLMDKTIPCDICDSSQHSEETCAMRFFPSSELVGSNVKLWVSCCYCASKSHLVGDCPSCPEEAPRWSLKGIRPGQVTNMSLESGTRRLEVEAENRNMRPQGMSIRGRADRHQRGQGNRRDDDEYDDEDDEFFIRPPVRQNQLGKIRFDRHGDREERLRRDSPQRGGPRSNPDSPRRYDRYDAPSDDRPSNQRSRGDWYQSDSFGRRRSRSPLHRARESQRAFPNRYESPSRDSRQPFHDYTPPDIGNDRWQPPLPREPPPGPRPQRDLRNVPPHQKQEIYRPMPSSAKQAWNRHRL